MTIRTKNVNDKKVNEEEFGGAIETPFWVVTRSQLQPRNISDPLNRWRLRLLFILHCDIEINFEEMVCVSCL